MKLKSIFVDYRYVLIAAGHSRINPVHTYKCENRQMYQR
jgi:hypothetical protein